MSPRSSDRSAGWFSRAGTFTLDAHSDGTPRICVPVCSSLIDYEEFYRLSPDQHAAFVCDPRAAKRFADECRKREHDDLLIPAPGWNRGTPRLPDESEKVQRAIMLLDTFTSYPQGLAMGVSAATGDRYLSIPAGEGHGSEEWIHFRISPDELQTFDSDIDAALAFADACRDGQHHDRLISLPEIIV